VDAAATALLERVQQAVIVKRGVKGAIVYTKTGHAIEAPPYPAEVVNFLGAGDAFASGLIYGYLQGWDWEQAARLGNACGALVVTRPGCANAMPTLDEALARMDDQSGQ
jgi:5-dehydro-2-deoxygluconokinase